MTTVRCCMYLSSFSQNRSAVRDLLRLHFFQPQGHNSTKNDQVNPKGGCSAVTCQIHQHYQPDTCYWCTVQELNSLCFSPLFCTGILFDSEFLAILMVLLLELTISIVSLVCLTVLHHDTADVPFYFLLLGSQACSSVILQKKKCKLQYHIADACQIFEFVRI